MDDHAYRTFEDAEIEYEQRRDRMPDARNRGAAFAPLISDGDAMTPAARAAEADVESLMREVPGGGPRGHGGGRAKNRTRKRPPGKKSQWTHDEQIHSDLRLVVWGLTPPEREFYRRRAHEARRVLTEFARYSLRGRVGLPGAVLLTPDNSLRARAFDTPSPARGTDYEVRGLESWVYDSLRANPGSARVALSVHAQRVDPDRCST